MTAPRDPWADPNTPTQPGAPYAGPPATVPGYGYGPQPGWGQQPYGYPGPYGSPAPWAPPPRRPERPAQVITAAVLAFVQATLVLISSLYLWMFASIADFFSADSSYAPGRLSELSQEGSVLAILQIVSAVLLVAGGVWALNSRRRPAWTLLLAAHTVQVVLAVYWLVRLLSLADEAPGADGQGAIAGLCLFFLAGPLTAVGLLLVGAGRHWFDQRA